MATFTKNHLSASTDGRPVLVVATATTGTTIHTGSSTAADFHEIWLWAMNSSAAGVKLTIEWGGTTAPNDLIEFNVPPESGLYQIVPGLLLQGNATPLIITAFAGSASVVNIHGFVNEVT